MAALLVSGRTIKRMVNENQKNQHACVGTELKYVYHRRHMNEVEAVLTHAGFDVTPRQWYIFIHYTGLCCVIYCLIKTRQEHDDSPVIGT